MNRFSRIITQGKTNGGAQAMLYALNLSKNDLSKPQVGICSMWYEGNPCNVKLNILSQSVKKNIPDNLLPLKFNTIGVSDGMSMGTTGMRYSLPSRDIIADSIETIMQAQHYDSLICIPGCDKNLPASVMALARLNRPGLIVYGGSMRPSITKKNERLDIVSAFESYGKYSKGHIDDLTRESIVKNACDKQCGSCSGMYTANTMACLIEVMGLMVPNGSSNLSLSDEKMNECSIAGKYLNNLIKKDIKPLDILTEKSLHNAIKMLYCMGGSTNAVIHLLSIAHSAGIHLTLDDFIKYEDMPVLANMKPIGEFVMKDLNTIGGTSKVIKYLIEENIIDGTCMTITGKNLWDNVKSSTSIQGQHVIRQTHNPVKDKSHIKILKGNLSPKGSVAKISKSDNIFSGKAIVFNSEQDMLDALNNHKITPEHFVIIRYQGESIGCPEMLSPTSAIIGYFGKDNDIPPLATDGRFSGGSHGILVAHLPDAYKKESITAIIKNNDIISIDTRKNKIHLHVDKEVINARKKTVQKPTLDISGSLEKYSKLVKDIRFGYCT